MTSVSSATSRAIYDDTQTAYRDPPDPCHVFAYLQAVAGHLDDQEWGLPIPFLETGANQGLVFVGRTSATRRPIRILESATHTSPGSLGLQMLSILAIGTRTGSKEMVSALTHDHRSEGN